MWGKWGEEWGVLGRPAEYLWALSAAFSFHLSTVGAGGPGEQRAGPGTASHGGRGGESGARCRPERGLPVSLFLQRSHTPGTARGRAGPPTSQGPWWVGVMSVRDFVIESSMLKTAVSPCPLGELVAMATTEGKAWDLWAPRSSSDLLGISWQIELGPWFPAWGTCPTGEQFDV